MRKTHFNSYSHFEEKKVLRCLEMFHEFALSLYSNFCEKEFAKCCGFYTHARLEEFHISEITAEYK